MQGRRNIAVRKELTQSLKHTGMRNYQETKKLGSSVDKFQKEFEKKLRDLSVQQSLLIASQRKRDSRRGSLPSSPSIELLGEEEKKGTNEEALKNSFSDSAIDKCTIVGSTAVKEVKPGSVTIANTYDSSSSSRPLKLPSIFDNLKDKGSRKIELEDSQSTKTSNENIFDKLRYSRQAKPRLDALDMTRKLSNGYSAMITASPPIMRATRRGSLQVSSLAVEEPVPNRRRLMRRGSCPNLGSRWNSAGKNVLGLETNEESLDEKTLAFSKHVEEMKKCRYLRFPKSITEDDEEDIDSLPMDK